MRTIFLLIISLIFVSSVQGAEKPNIIFMLADDQGWNGLSVAMHPQIAGSRSEMFNTPNLEKLAAQGMRFSAAYAPAPVCSPTRISIQTGKSPAALHWTKAAPAELGHKLIEPKNIRQIPDNEVTIGELLKQAGYATAHYGKWHIAGVGPEKHGYDESDGDTGNEHAYQYKDPNPVDIFGMADKAAKFMEKSQKSDKPFYIQLSWNALHASENALKSTLVKYEQLGGKNTKQMTTAAITEDLDTGVGRVLEAIERLGLAKNTYVIYTSDNGGGGGKKALNGGKGDVYEGGVRVPLIIRGPGIKPNSWSHVRVVGYDFLPTFCAWAGLAESVIPMNVEGGSIVPLLQNEGQGVVKRTREEIVFHFPHYQGNSPHSAIILGDLKLMHFYEDDHDELYDLVTDLGERKNLAASRPKETSQLRTLLQKYLAAVDAQFPSPNPNYNPARPMQSPPKGGKNNPKKQGKN